MFVYGSKQDNRWFTTTLCIRSTAAIVWGVYHLAYSKATIKLLLSCFVKIFIPFFLFISYTFQFHLVDREPKKPYSCSCPATSITHKTPPCPPFLRGFQSPADFSEFLSKPRIELDFDFDFKFLSVPAVPQCCPPVLFSLFSVNSRKSNNTPNKRRNFIFPYLAGKPNSSSHGFSGF